MFVMVADAGVFQGVTIRAFLQVQVEPDDGGLFLGLHPDLDDGGDVQALGKSLVGEEGISLSGEAHARGAGALSADDSHGLFPGCGGLALCSEKGDLELAVPGHQEFGVGMDFVEDLATVWACLPGMVMVMVVFFVVLPGPSGLDKGAEAEGREEG